MQLVAAKQALRRPVAEQVAWPAAAALAPQARPMAAGYWRPAEALAMPAQPRDPAQFETVA
ncbi:MAG TPA: hypothetical protein VGF03_01645 [Bryobacteraceae bacterium]|jgi:hypothetical protein